ncbi:TonB-dependent receptor [Dyadobacter sediminis]|uniref:TonB-dependent receptor n=1 Tax=Dyadobacter sediminis TaxID=1493691 RepID=A0A5R9KDV3_9BACT|nr:TonB-dependent receptor [Dyadobacter sediminis]TLU94228.1 TonB-dependent receptor [Dyadobacter sediminis]GGB93098.1 TonB-dependent receptor [Dyadobacter sediminis]
MKLYFTILIFFTAFAASAGTKISGIVTDQKGEAVPGSNVYIKGSYDGTSSDVNGGFSFETDLSGKQVLMVQALGFKPQETVIECNGQTLELKIKLSGSINLLTAVTITAGAMEAGDEKKSVVLKPLDIVTTSGAMGDITGALLTLPGTSTVGNDGRLFVRGGDASETSIFIDGLQVGNAYGSTASNVPTRNRFSANLFRGSFFSTGGYSAEYGQALSSALALSTVNLPLRSQGDVSIMSVGGGYTQTLTGKQNALTASANYYNLAPYQSLVKQDFDWEKSPESWDSEISLRHKWGNAANGKAGFIKAYFHTEGNRMTIWQKIPGDNGRGDRIQLRNRYSYSNVSFRHSGKKDWFFYGGLAFSHNSDALKRNADPLRRTNQLAHAKIVAVKDFSPRFSLKNGLEWFVKAYSETMTDVNRTRNYTDHQLNHFAEATYYFSNRLIMVAGVRSGHSSLAEQVWMTPRFSVAWKLDHQGQFSFAAGKFKQLPEEKIRVAQNNLQNTAATHYILNYFIVNNNRTFRAESFYKIYDHLVTYDDAAGNYSNFSQNGSGYARGMDFFYRDRKSIKGTDFWITYSFVDSKRKYAAYETLVQPSFAPKHNGSIVVKHFASALKSQLGTSWSWNSGYPFSNPNRTGEMQQKTKMYSDLSISWSYLPRPDIILHVACSNVLGRNNVFGYRYALQPDESGAYIGLPVGQGAKRFAFAALFITISRDKNANQLNNL